MVGAGEAGSGGLLERNLRVLGPASAGAASRVRAATTRGDVSFCLASDGCVTGAVGVGDAARWLSSRRSPGEEASRLASDIDPASCAAVVIVGFGVGHHVASIARRMGRAGLVIVFEPDVSLLRGVLERVDHSGALSGANVALLTDAGDAAAIAEVLRGLEGVVSLGVRVVEHAPSVSRMGAEAGRFSATLAQVLRAVRTNVVTTLMQMETSLRNGLMNLDHYSTGLGVGELAGLAKGRPAVVVSAGPSLRRNMHLLARPGVRERVVIIATQTVLRPLLAAGVRPHYVTALDYHEISRRFYEGLTRKDVEGVALVVEPKANPAILDAFPGVVRCSHDAALSSILGAEFPRDGVTLEPGATVAHLAYTLARHLGCDPVILVGQDLGFTDGQYYSAGAAIHDVWAPELNDFNTLETMEWQRIVRNRRHLVRGVDHAGRAIYTDEQMGAYLVQFERLFARDAGRGLTTVDATEGGVRKAHARPSTLEEALAGASALLPDLEARDAGERGHAAGLERAAERVGTVARDARRIVEVSRRTAGRLEEMLAHHDDQGRVNRLIRLVQADAREVAALSPAFELVQQLNQTGQLKRVRADRRINLDPSLTPVERQRRRIERDLTNVRWLADAGEQLVSLLDAARAALRGAPKLMRDPSGEGGGEEAGEGVVVEARARTVGAIIPVDPGCSGLGARRDLGRPFVDGLNPLRLTLARLARARGVDRVVLLTCEPERVREILGPDARRAEIVETPEHPLGERRHGVAASRALACDCWRGAPGGLTVFDEVIHPVAHARALAALGLDAVLCLGPDWCALDPELTSEVVERYRQKPASQRLTFASAGAGLAPCCIDRSLMDELAAVTVRAGAFASVGGLLGYIPIAPIPDPLAKGGCVGVDPALRDAPVRCIPDSPWREELLARAFRDAGDDAVGVKSARIVRALGDRWADAARAGPARMTLELCTGRLTGGIRAAALRNSRDARDRLPARVGASIALVEELAGARPDAVLTLGGTGDPMMHPGWREVARAARAVGLRVHLRTDLLCDPEDVSGLVEEGVDAVSVDLLAHGEEVYRRTAGAADFRRAHANVLSLARSCGAGGLPRTWIVPRITRCDAAIEEIERFYDHWLLSSRACVIDPLPAGARGERIEALPLPALASARARLGELVVLSDLSVGGLGDRTPLAASPLVRAWREVLRRRLGRSEGHAGLRTIAAAA